MTDVSRLLESRRSRLGRWVGAAAIVCALHVGGVALALMHWPEEEAEDDAAGAMTVELAPLPAAVRIDSPEVAYGPEQEEAKLAPEASKEVVVEEEEHISPVPPSPAPEPEVALPKPQPEEKEPEEEKAQEAVAEPERPQQDQETLAAAPPRVEAQPVPSSAPSQGLSPSLARAMASWQSALSRQLNRHKRIPKAALGQRGRWEAVVAFTVDRSGRVISAELKKSTGVPVLDEEALEWLQRASPFPPPPDIPGIELHYIQSIEFGVK
jgi:protein TonB